MLDVTEPIRPYLQLLIEGAFLGLSCQFFEPVVNVIELFSSSLMKRPTKLERLSLATLNLRARLLG
jgi:hypothetical protein